MKSIIEPTDRIKKNISTPYVLMEEFHSSEDVKIALLQRLSESNIDNNEIKTKVDLSDIVYFKDIKVIHYLMNIGYWIIQERTAWLNVWEDIMCESIKSIFPNLYDYPQKEESWIRRMCIRMCKQPFFIKNKKGVALWEIMLKKRFIHPWILRKTFIPLLFAYFLSLYFPLTWLQNDTIGLIFLILPIIVYGFLYEGKNNWTIIINLCFIGLVHILSVLYIFENGFEYEIISSLVHWSIITFALSIMVQIEGVFVAEYDMLTTKNTLGRVL